MVQPILEDAFGHHVWATLQVIDACQLLSEDQLAAEVPGTYGSILSTLRHIVAGDAGYLFALTDGRISEIDEDGMDLPELRAATESYAAAWSDVIGQASDPETTVTRHRDDGTDSHAPLGVRLAQALHHGSDHRSQICTVLTTLGVEPPEIDVWDYAEKDGRISVTPAAS